MKNPNFSIVLGSFLLLTFAGCSKTESGGSTGQMSTADQTVAMTEVSDSISSVASAQVKDKQFIKSADVNMEVKDVYDATIFIENSLKNLGGFVTSSQLNSQTLSENTYTISDEKSMLVRKFQTENRMEVRVPTEKLGELLQFINDKKVFLNSRIILAEDVTSNIKLAELEAKRNTKTGTNIEKLKQDKGKVNMGNANDQEGNYQEISSFDMKDQLKYSNVKIYVKEPQVRIAQIPVVNIQNIDDQYKYNFLYDAKNALVEGFYLIQKIILGLLKIWPLVLIGLVITFFYRRKKIKADES